MLLVKHVNGNEVEFFGNSVKTRGGDPIDETPKLAYWNMMAHKITGNVFRSSAVRCRSDGRPHPGRNGVIYYH